MELAIPGHTIRKLLAARYMDAPTLAHRSGVSQDRVSAALSGAENLEESEVGALANGLAVPVEELVPRRCAGNRVGIGFPQRAASALRTGSRNDVGHRFRRTPIWRPSQPRSSFPGRCASRKGGKVRLRNGDRISQKVARQLELFFRAAAPRSGRRKGLLFASRLCKNLGAFVLHWSFGHTDVSGFYTQVDAGPHTIVINTYHASNGRKAFTLAHEFCHLLTRTEGISDTSWIRNRIEKFCNKFAAALLAPSGLIKLALSSYSRAVSADNDFIRLFSKRLGISQDAAFLRLVELDQLTWQEYEAWKSQFKGRIPSGDMADQGGGGGGDPIKAKRTKYGSSLLRALDYAKSEGLLDEIDIFRFIGLKPKYQRELFHRSALAAS